jgi:nucleotide-binding universal stress UspA family protein
VTSPTFGVPLDGSEYSERALPVATVLAQRTGGHLLLVSVQFHGPLRPREYLAEIAEQPRPVPVETSGDSTALPVAAIAAVVGESDDRIVCMTSHGRGGLRWSLLGSVAEEVVRRVERPTLLVGHHCREDFLADARYLLACVDRNESSREFAPIVTDWATRLQLDMHAAVVVHPHDFGTLENPDAVLQPVVEQFGGPDRIAATLLTGRYPAGALADYAADLRAAVIAVHGHFRTGAARFALGSTTMGLVHQVHCPVLVTPRSMTEGQSP